MGVLSDDAPATRTRGGHGDKFVQIFRELAADDQARIRKWNDNGKGEPIMGGISHVWRQLKDAGFDIGYTAVEHGINRLRGSQWEC